MSDFMQQALARSPKLAPQWLSSWHQRGRATWQAAQFPTRKTEAWKYTNLRLLEQGGYRGEGKALTPGGEAALRDEYAIAGLNANTLTFVNGHFNEQLSHADMPAGVEWVRFAEASEEQVEAIKNDLGSVSAYEQHLFASLNESLLDDGLFIRIGKNVRMEKPLHVVWLTTAGEEAFTVSQRVLVVAESGSEATVVEHFTSERAPQNSFTNGVTELVLRDNARLNHYRLHLEEEHALHIGGVHAELNRDAVLNSFHLAMGSALKRVDVVINHRGEGAHCDLNGVYLPRNDEHVDYHTTIEHAVPRCTTSENFRGIIGDSARAVFNGRIHIHRDAQKTLAQLSNKNLLTSNKAEVDTKPELEIYADDVQCAHGATVAQLDETSVHYLRTRGVSKREAEVMLSFGFINELVDKLKHKAISDYLRPMLAQRFARDGSLMRHIA